MADFLTRIKKSYSIEDVQAIEYAYNFACAMHKGQKRNSGEDYFTHPVAVATILLDFGLDVDSIIAALLHDTMEDTKVSKEDIKQKFGQNIAEMVDAVTKLTKLNIKVAREEQKEVEQAENIRKLFLAMAKDIRVIMVKLADRLHNMRTLDSMTPEKQIQKSRETLEVYAPLAARLGMSNLKCELEDLSMKYLYPDDYKFLTEKLDVQRDERMKFVKRIADEITSALADLNIHFEIKGRPKHYYSIYKKMKNQDKSFEEIYDLVAVRIIVDTVSDCYSVLGIIHSMWRPIPGRIKDYIASPKPNLYQSLHTTIVTNFGQVFEIQIRTVEMNRIAEYGIAAHWKYKEGRTNEDQSDLDKRLGWIKEVMDIQGDMKDSREFLDILKMTVAPNEIYVYTPKGDIFDLPIGATGIDFAYRVHTEVGNKCYQIFVNNNQVPFSRALVSGDVVEVKTRNDTKGPSRDWLKYAKTPAAQAKIKSFFKRELKDENIKRGKTMLEEEAKNKGYNYGELSDPAILKVIFGRYGFSDTDEMFASVGYGGIKINQILFKLIEYFKKKRKIMAAASLALESTPDKEVVRKKIHSGIVVEGYDDFLIRIAHCCNPLPGDRIIGFVSRGRGISIHKEDCPNMRNTEKERLMEAKWANNSSDTFSTNINITCGLSNSLISDITTTLTKMDIEITALSSKLSKARDMREVSVWIEIHSASDVARVIHKLEGLKGIFGAQRGQ